MFFSIEKLIYSSKESHSKYTPNTRYIKMEQGINAGNILLTRFNKNKSNHSLLIQDFVIKKPDMAKNMITPRPPKVVIPRKVGSVNPESEY
ncbi:hypothetical protein BIZ41_26905 [Escherichia coli]|nr:hypothetical protein BIZ41_26905 [Escherichia coli]